MTKKKLSKQFCKDNHDTFIVGRTNVSGACKQCHRENSTKYNSQYYKTHLKKFQNQNKKKYYSNKEYSKICSKENRWKQLKMINSNGVLFTRIDFDRLYQIQSGKCAICKKHQTELTYKLSVDHNHKTGIVRGLLCISCNTKLGYFEDKDFHKEANQYLRNEMRGED